MKNAIVTLLLLVSAVMLAGLAVGESVIMSSENEGSAAEAASTEMDIVDTAINAGTFTTLVNALQEAELVDTLKGSGPFTVFAPTDEAFAKLSEADLDALLADKDKLTAVLTYHVVPENILSADLSDGMTLTTVQGADIEVEVSDAGVMVDGSKVTQADIEASNGVIHVIDTVIMPPE